MIDFLFNYIVSIWFYENSDFLFTVISGVTFVSMIMMLYLLSREDSINKIYFYYFFYTIIGLNIIIITLYGYISFPLAVLWTIHAKKAMHDRAIECYIRDRNGHIEQEYYSSYDGSILDYDYLIKTTTCDKEELKKYCSSYKAVIYAWLLGGLYYLYVY